MVRATKQNYPGQVEICIRDLSIEHNGNKAMKQVTDGFEPYLIGLSATTHEDGDLNHFSMIFRQRFPGAFIVGGGPHTNTATGYVVEKSSIDFIALGEGR